MKRITSIPAARRLVFPTAVRPPVQKGGGIPRDAELGAAHSRPLALQTAALLSAVDSGSMCGLNRPRHGKQDRLPENRGQGRSLSSRCLPGSSQGRVGAPGLLWA